MSSVIVITLDISVFPSDQEINSYPSSAVAVRVTSVSSCYSPDPVTVPPSPSVSDTGINSVAVIEILEDIVIETGLLVIPFDHD